MQLSTRLCLFFPGPSRRRLSTESYVIDVKEILFVCPREATFSSLMLHRSTVPLKWWRKDWSGELLPRDHFCETEKEKAALLNWDSIKTAIDSVVQKERQSGNFLKLFFFLSKVT